MNISLGQLANLDLLSVGIAIAGNLILGAIVFFSNRKSATTILFLLLSFVISAWSLVNYVSYQSTNKTIALILVRLVLFFAAPIGAFFLFFIDAFPEQKMHMSRKEIVIVSFFAVLTMILTLTPLVFSDVTLVEGSAPKPTVGPGILSFIVVPVLAIIFGIILLIKRTIKASQVEKKQYRLLSIGVALMFGLILVLNFVFPAFLNNTRFIPLSALFTFPFVAFTAYAIIRHGLLKIKVITTEIVAFLLAVVSIFEVILAQDIVTRVFRFGVFSLVLGFSILLIRSVRKEVEQRERLQKLTEELGAANDKLKALDKLRAEFLSFAAHQVKAPMAVVKGYAELIADGSYGEASDKIKETAIKIKESADRLVALVNNLLDMRKIEEGKMDFTFGQVDIVGLLRSMTEEYKIIGTHKGLAVSFESPVESFKIKADEQKIRQVIQNVIDNSIKYTDTRSTSSGQAGFVKVSFKDEGTKVLIAVTDNGRGISAELQKKLFQQFVRDEKTKLEIQGTGLGLYIAKQIVAAHNGEIWVESPGEGKGSTFSIRLAKE